MLDMINAMAERLEGAGFERDGADDSRAEAIRRLALWSGALGMARAASDELAEEILEAARSAPTK